ncbi:MAG: formimidoylglutamase, partial [Candidatus Kapabacteria bacterium]|nr:formimidoylglutamase [Candidatus Kapabacteria bacterium]
KSGDPQDLRLGDVIVHASEIPDGCERAIVLIGVPQDIGVERNGGRQGAALAPTAIRKALSKLTVGPMHESIQTGRLVLADAGDLDVEGKTLEQIHDEQHDIVAAVLREGHLPIILGGGHDCAWPTIRALETMGLPYGVINIDAHADVRPLKEGRSHSGSPFYQLLTMSNSHLLAGGFTEFGLQTHSVAASHLEFVRAAGMQAWMLDEVRHDGINHAWQRAWEACSLAHRTYVSLDMDAFASAYAPGVSAPAADGFIPSEISACLRHAAASGSLVAFDIVEVNPTYDVDGRTAKLAATMIWELVTSH